MRIMRCDWGWGGGGRKEGRGGKGTGNLTAAVTQEEGGDVWRPASRAVENSGPD